MHSASKGDSGGRGVTSGLNSASPPAECSNEVFRHGFWQFPCGHRTRLSLQDAVRLALRGNKAIAGAAAGSQASQSRVTEAEGGRLPKVNYSESFARSDNPVFVFSSLLTQHQFGADNFSHRPAEPARFSQQLSVAADGGSDLL